MTDTKYFAKVAPTRAREALDNARDTLERALAELNRHIEKFDQAENLGDQAEAVGKALNHLATYPPNNIRLDVLAQAHAALMVANTLEITELRA